MLRLLAAFAVTLVVLAALQVTLVGHDLRARLIDASAMRQVGDAARVQQAWDEAGAGTSRIRAAEEVVRAVARRDGTRQVLLIAADGTVAASGGGRRGYAAPIDAEVRATLRDGEHIAGVQHGEGHTATLQYVAPVTLDGRRFALLTHDDVGPLRRQIGDLRRRAAQLVLLGLLVGVPVFYLLGGRSLAQHHRRALDDARRDPLTDLGSQRIFHEQIQRAVDHALLADEYLALAVVDVDDFKIVNDRHGHRRGDEVLCDVAARLRRLGGPRGMAFRTGGDEFAVVLPGHDARDAWTVLEGVRRAVEDESLGVTISAGVADLCFGVRDVELLHDHADLAAYEAKRRGRNQVVSYDRLGARAVALDAAMTRRAA